MRYSLSHHMKHRFGSGSSPSLTANGKAAAAAAAAAATAVAHGKGAGGVIRIVGNELDPLLDLSSPSSSAGE